MCSRYLRSAEKASVAARETWWSVNPTPSPVIRKHCAERPMLLNMRIVDGWLRGRHQNRYVQKLSINAIIYLKNMENVLWRHGEIALFPLVSVMPNSPTFEMKRKFISKLIIHSVSSLYIKKSFDK